MEPRSETADGPVAGLVARMLRRRSRMRRRRFAARAVVGLLAVGRWWGVFEYLGGYSASLHPMLETTLFDSGLLLLAFTALGSARVGPQLVARAALIGQLWVFATSAGQGSVAGLVFAIGSVVVLALLGADRLEPDDGPFRPIHFRGILIGCILLDGSLGLHGVRLLVERFGVVHVGFPIGTGEVVVVLCLLTAAVGLYRLRTIALALPILVAATQLPGLANTVLHHGPDAQPDFVPFFFLAADVALVVTVVPVVWGLVRLRRVGG